jgi:hypothetical protein
MSLFLLEKNVFLENQLLIKLKVRKVNYLMGLSSHQLFFVFYFFICIQGVERKYFPSLCADVFILLKHLSLRLYKGSSYLLNGSSIF